MTLAALLLLAALADTSDVCPGGTVLDRSDLEARGVVAVHDLVRAAGLDGVTVDGYDATPLVAWGSPAEVRLLIDGAPVATTAAFEPLGLEPLPLTVGEIARVVACPGPGLAGGVWGGPWIDIETAMPARAAAAGLYGNETGDPGPDLYLDPTLDNVDRWGPDGEAAVAATLGPVRAGLSLRHHRLIPTDPALAERLFDAVTPDRYLLRSGTAVAGTGAVPGGRLRLGAYRSSDLPFVPAVGREVPVDRRTVQATVSGAGQAGVGRFRGHFHVSRLRASRPAEGLLPLGPDGTGPGWEERRLDAAASVERERDGRSVGAGLQGEAALVRGPGLDAAVATGRAWVRVRRMRGGRADALAVQLTAGPTGPLLGGVATARRPLSASTEVHAALALDRQPPSGLAPWLRRGYAGLNGADVSVGTGPERSRTVAVARVGVVARPGRVRLEVSGEVQRARGDIASFDLVDGGVAPRGTVRYVQAQGTTGRLRARARWTSGRWTVSGSGHIQGAIGGDDAFREVWERVPVSSGDLRLTLRPDSRLALWSALRTRSAAPWTGVPGDAPAVALLDLGLSKRLWQDRLVVAVTGRNVLDAPERTHPLGAVLAPRLFVRLAASF